MIAFSISAQEFSVSVLARCRQWAGDFYVLPPLPPTSDFVLFVIMFVCLGLCYCGFVGLWRCEFLGFWVSGLLCLCVCVCVCVCSYVCLRLSVVVFVCVSVFVCVCVPSVVV